MPYFTIKDVELCFNNGFTILIIAGNEEELQKKNNQQTIWGRGNRRHLEKETFFD